MARKQTYEELEQRVKELEAEVDRHHRLQKNLQETEARFRAFMDNNPAVAYIKNESGQHMYCNKTLFDKFDMSPDKFLGTTTRDFFPPAEAEKIEAYDEVVKTEGVSVETDDWSDKWRGQTRWWKEIKFPIKLPSGGMLIGGIAFDITERKQREEKMQMMQFAMDNAMDRIAWIAPDGRFLYANEAACKEMGYTLEEVLSMRVSDIDPNFPIEKWAEHYQEVKKRGSMRLETQQIAGDGETHDVEVFTKVLKSGDHEFMCSFGRDITELKKVGRELENALSQIELLNERLEAENIYLREEIKLEHQHESFIGKSHAVKYVLRQAEEVAKTDSTVLILGETGTGKELLAREIHNLSARKDRPMVNVNCVSLPPTLVEAELFGREKGAYTGALTKQVGRFEIADGATIFLDEIGELPVDLQVKLLRVLDEGQFERLGSPKTITVDVRIVAATNRDLERAVEEGKFREDLFHRLNVYPIKVLPLRERLEDIAPLIWAFVREFGERMGKKIDQIPRNSIEALKRYDWPGNVRELRNMVERAMIVSKGSTLKIDSPRPKPARSSRIESLDELQRNHIVRALETTGWRVSGKNGAAEMLKINPKTLESRMRKLGINRNTQIS